MQHKKKVKRVETQIEAIEALLEGKQCAISERLEYPEYNMYQVDPTNSEIVNIYDTETMTLLVGVDNHKEFIKLCKYFKWELDPISNQTISFTPSPLNDRAVYISNLIASYYYGVHYGKRPLVV